jgi:DNA processing protein
VNNIARPIMLPSFHEGERTVSDQHAPRLANDLEFDTHFLALSLLHGIGLNALRALMDSLADLSLIWREDPKAIEKVLRNARVPSSQALAKRIRDDQIGLLQEGRQLRDHFLQRGIRVIPDSHEVFPARLREIPDAPRWLFIEGDPAILNAGSFIAVVGTRESTEAGHRTAGQVTWLAARAGLGVVSGLAEGIDAAAHQMAARRSIPQVAVLGTGINIVFPRSTANLRRQIVATGGCVITEYLPDDAYGKARFVQRNRIQAGLSEAICPVEGRAQSGTMHTVRFAEKYGRKLFGATRGAPVPGNEMPSILSQMDKPVFDLESPAGKEQLRAFLRELPGERFPEPPRPDPEFMLRNVLRAIDVVASYDELTRDEKHWLMDQLRMRLGMDEETGIPNGD